MVNKKLKPKRKHLMSTRLRSSLYCMMNDAEFSKITAPISPNSLTFLDKTLESDYSQKLYFNSDTNSPSEEFTSDLLFFYIFLTLMCISFGAFSMVFYTEKSITSAHLAFHLVFLSTILITSYTWLFYLYKSPKCLKNTRLGMTILGLLCLTYLAFGREHILAKILDDQEGSKNLPLEIGFVSIIISFRIVLFDSFLHTICLVLYGLFLFLVLNISVLTERRSEIFSDFFLVLLTLALQIAESHILDYRSKVVFWMQARDERNYRTTASIRLKTDDFINSESELLIKACENVQNTLKKACSVIMYRDIRDALKLSQIELESIKQRIGSTIYATEIKFEDGYIDAEDKEFIAQNFVEIGYKSEKSSNSQTTLMNFSDKSHYPFSHYGLEMLESILCQIGQNWNFNIFFLQETTGNSLSIISKYLFQKWKLTEFLQQKQETVDNFFQRLELEYIENPYHNSLHAADVLHSSLYFIMQSNLQNCVSLNELINCIIAASGHDAGHPGLTNRFLVNNRDKIAIKYNDMSVLENMHASKTYKIMITGGSNLFEFLNNDEYVRSRKMIISMILETDMSRHFEVLGKFRARVSTLSNIDIENFEDKIQILSMGLKCADVGHSAKDQELHEKWTELVCEEFFSQGDLEKQRGQAVSMYCDRETTNISKSQAGFIKNICLPLYEIWASYLQSVKVDKNVIMQLKNNMEYWSSYRKRRETTKVPVNKIEDYKRIMSTK